MSSQKGNVTKQGPPKHQNTFAFRHNPKSKKTEVILSLPNEGLCRRCHDKIEWKKKYRKYKRLTAAKRCASCGERSITHAYHNVCQACARAQSCCAWCREQSEIVRPTKTPEEIRLEQLEEEAKLAQMSLRERRSYLRAKEHDEGAGGDDDDDDDDESSDSDEDGQAAEKDSQPKAACDSSSGSESDSEGGSEDNSEDS